MSFPGTYNINYYYGDTLEFRVYPKNSSGEIFNLASFELARFTIAPSRDAEEEDKISAYAVIDSDKTNILCSIRPEDSLKLDPNTAYVYDVEIRKSGDIYDVVYTLLTGNVSITKSVTAPETNVLTQLPDNPTNLVLSEATSSSISVSWIPPTTGGPVEFYRVAIIPFTTNASELETAAASGTLISGNLNQHVFFNIQENTDYSVAILSNNGLGNASLTTLLTNATAFRTLDNPLTIEPDFVVLRDAGSTAYVINGESNPTLTLVRGETYIFSIQTSGDPFWIQTVAGGFSDGDEYSEGVTGNGTAVGTILWTVPESAPDNLYYASSNTFVMHGAFEIVDGES